MKARNNQRWLKIPFLLLLIFGCSLDPIVKDADSLGEYFVYCTLCPSFSALHVKVGKSVPESLPKFIDNAKVSVYSTSQKIDFRYDKNGLYKNSERELDLLPDSTYKIKVVLENGVTISGQTKLPGDFEILYPTAGDTITHYYYETADSLLLPWVSWSPSARANYYTVETFINDSGYWGHNRNTVNQKIVVPYITKQGGEMTNEVILSAEIFVATRDSSFKFVEFSGQYEFAEDYTEDDLQDYYEDPFFAYYEDKNNLIGATGVFNGMTVKSVPVYIKLLPR